MLEVRFVMLCCYACETSSEAKIHITAGACMAIGLKFAGTANRCAFECLVGIRVGDR